MAELDKREPFGSVKIHHRYSTNSGGKDKEQELSTKVLDNRKIRLENKESAYLKAITKLEAYDRTLAKLSTQSKHSEAERNKYVAECKKSQAFISMLESEYEVVLDQLVESIKNSEQLLRTNDELKMQFVVMQDLEIENLEKTVSTDYYQLELIQAKELLDTKMEILQDERNKVCDCTRQFDMLNDESFEYREKGAKDKMMEELYTANVEINELKATLEETRRRAEIAENAKLEIEERLRTWREKQKMRRVASEAHEEECSGGNIGRRSASLQEGKIFKSVPLGKFLNIKL